MHNLKCGRNWSMFIADQAQTQLYITYISLDYTAGEDNQCLTMRDDHLSTVVCDLSFAYRFVSLRSEFRLRRGSDNRMLLRILCKAWQSLKAVDKFNQNIIEVVILWMVSNRHFDSNALAPAKPPNLLLTLVLTPVHLNNKILRKKVNAPWGQWIKLRTSSKRRSYQLYFTEKLIKKINTNIKDMSRCLTEWFDHNNNDLCPAFTFDS